MRTDILPGDPLRLKVSTTAPTYQIHVYRAGWYGGRLMREIWASGVLAGHRQAPATPYAPTHTIVTLWRPNNAIDTDGRCPTTPAGSRIITAVTLRLLLAMAGGPMGLAHPARGNLPALHAYPGDPVAANAANAASAGTASPHGR